MDKNYFINKLSNIMDIDYVNELLRLINIRCKNVRTPKYSNEYYLYYIILVLTDLQKWNSLSKFLENVKSYHYKTISDIHLKWSRLNIYEDAYKILLKKYKKIKTKKSANLVLFIDSTNIYNKYGCEKIGYGEDPKKKKTKVSAICDENKNILSIVVTKTKLKESKFNGKKFMKPTLRNDTKTVKSTINKMIIDPFDCKSLKLVGDKGYSTNKLRKLTLKYDYNTEIIYPHKKIQKTKTPEKYKKLLKKRHVIENVFARLKRFDRICLRKDRLEVTFIGFLFLATICMFKK